MGNPQTDWKDKENAESLFLTCDCHSEGVEIQYYHEDNNDCGYYLNFWKYGISQRSYSGWIDRIKFAFKLLINGTLHGDQIILSKKSASKLSDYIIKYKEHKNG